MGKGLKKHFPKEDTHMANKNMKRYSTSFIIGEMQIKTTVTYYLIYVRIAMIEKTRENNY